MKPFPIVLQQDQMDCGPACLQMISKYYGKSLSIEELRKQTFLNRDGVSLLGLSEGAEAVGFKTLMAKVNFEELDKEVNLPCILHWNQNHFVVLPPQNYSQKKGEIIRIADPAFGLMRVDKETFLRNWLSPASNTGIALILEPTQKFFEQQDSKANKGLSFLLRYLLPHRKHVFQLFLGMLLASVLALIFPFLTQLIVDYGVNLHDLNFIQLILICQLALTLGTTTLDSLRSWILLHMNSRVNIAIISDFLIKLMKLPIRFFDTKMLGDITQRLADHRKIEAFLTNDTLSTAFSLVTLIVFSIVLGIYSLPIVLIFLVGSGLSIGWILIFLKRRKDLDYQQFHERAFNQNSINELILGMQEIKITNSEIQKRWSWQRTQIRLFRLNLKSLSLEQFQKIGNIFLLQVKNILIFYFSAKEVIAGNMTIGMMLSVSYIIGQMNSPIEQLLNFIRSLQDAKISLERLNDIHAREDEEHAEALQMNSVQSSDHNNSHDIYLEDIVFKYDESSTGQIILDKVSIKFPKGKVTAIVGMSGSGKTTLMKLLLRFYEPLQGAIRLGDVDLKNISPRSWRSRCGVVMQEGFIFSDTIARNIAVGEDTINHERLVLAAKLANIDGFIGSLPLRFQTKIGNTGNGISTGQKLRILIARAIYKNPDYLFLDEATSSLDANNERKIIENLNSFFKNRTVIVIAHRLSTVKHADQIIVMENGRVVETGVHDELVRAKGKYYELVKNQLELSQ